MSLETWLVVAAERFELGGILRRLRGASRLSWPLAFAAAGELRTRKWICVANGPGPELAGQAVDAALGRESGISRLLSVGLCGALNPGYRVGEIFAAVEVRTPGGQAYPAVAPVSGRPFHKGVLVSLDHVAQSAAEKRALRERFGGDAVEMEAGAVAARAWRANLPFHCVRAVSDAAADGFSLDFNTARSPDGRFSAWKVVISALERPWTRVPELFRLARDSRRAALGLGEFLAECEFC